MSNRLKNGGYMAASMYVTIVVFLLALSLLAFGTRLIPLPKELLDHLAVIYSN